METFSALLALCARNSPVAGEFPAQRPVRRSFDVFFDLRLNKWLSKPSWGWWLETQWLSLWRHCNVLIRVILYFQTGKTDKAVDILRMARGLGKTSIAGPVVTQPPTGKCRHPDEGLSIGCTGSLIWHLQVQPVTKILSISHFLLSAQCLTGTKWLEFGRHYLLAFLSANCLKDIEAVTKWPPFCRRRFKMHFLEWKCVNFN